MNASFANIAKSITKRFVLAFLVGAFLSAAFLGHASAQEKIFAEKLFINGTIHTLAKGKRPEVVAVTGQKIVYVGSAKGAKAFVSPTTQVVDLKGATLLPGFIDGHIHAASGTMRQLFEVQLAGIENPSVEKYLEAIRAFALDPKNKDLKIIRGGGWINGVFAAYNTKQYGAAYEQLGPAAKLLDDALVGTPHENTPAFFNSEDGHILWANSSALKAAGLLDDTTMPDPAGGRIERDPKTKKPWGVFKESARALIREKLPPAAYTPEHFATAIEKFQQEMNSYGITGVMAISGSTNATAGPMAEAFKMLDRAGKLDLIYRASMVAGPGEDPGALVAQTKELQKVFTGDRFKVIAVKLFIDGVVEGRTAYLLEPYADNAAAGDPADYKGKLIWEDTAELTRMIEAIDAAKIQVHVHSIGDGATRIVLDAYEKAQRKNGVRDSRHVLTHLQLVDPADIARMAKLGAVASVQPYWFHKEPGYFYEVEVPALGQVRAQAEYPMASFFKAGVLVSSSSDGPVTSRPAPLRAIEVGVTRNKSGVLPEKYDTLGAAEAVTRRQMVESFTVGAARQIFAEDLMGSIAKGKLANFVVLEKDILDEAAVKNWEIAKTKVLATYFLGEEVYSGK